MKRSHKQAAGRRPKGRRRKGADMLKDYFVKNILKGFKADTAIEYYINGKLMDYKTVGEYMNSGLTTYDSIEAGALEIAADKIIIRV